MNGCFVFVQKSGLLLEHRRVRTCFCLCVLLHSEDLERQKIFKKRCKTIISVRADPFVRDLQMKSNFHSHPHLKLVSTIETSSSSSPSFPSLPLLLPLMPTRAPDLFVHRPPLQRASRPHCVCSGLYSRGDVIPYSPTGLFAFLEIKAG